jgi:hypothetical protein
MTYYFLSEGCEMNKQWSCIIRRLTCLIRKLSGGLGFFQFAFALTFLWHIAFFTPRTLRAGGTRCCSWLRQCATSRKFAGSIPDGVTGILHWHNPSGRTMVLRSTQPLTEMDTRDISCVQRRPLCNKASCADCPEIWEPSYLYDKVEGLWTR